MMKSRRKALRSLTQEKVVSIGDYRKLRHGKTLKRVAFVTSDKALAEGIKAHFQTSSETEIHLFDGRFSLEQALKTGEWDGVLLDERAMREDAIALCEKLKRHSSKFEDLFVVILSDNADKELIRKGYESGCDEWISKMGDTTNLARLLEHHISD